MLLVVEKTEMKRVVVSPIAHLNLYPLRKKNSEHRCALSIKQIFKSLYIRFNIFFGTFINILNLN